ncbi:SinR family protein [Novosphingobium barchaimii LL02]|uniref:SinR family protein n=2 Tax=Novosphingobium barchaimii TaxID=1420591 RepID=A0A0J7Y5H8_9SPHN|nr:SinR family protein [Novosphingobium barchaimii LL02]
MANNLHVSYDLNSPGQNYEKVIGAIKTLGDWGKIHKSYFYVTSNYTSSQAADIVWAAMDSSDTVYVVDATNNTAHWYNVDTEVTSFIKERWA